MPTPDRLLIGKFYCSELEKNSDISRIFLFLGLIFFMQPSLVIPDSFESKQKLLTVGLDMHLKHNGDTFAKVVQRLSMGEKY